MSRPVPRHAIDPDTGEIDFDAVERWTASLVANAVFAGALAAGEACKDFVYLVGTERLDLDNMALDTADPLVETVETFVKTYRKLYGDPVR